MGTHGGQGLQAGMMQGRGEGGGQEKGPGTNSCKESIC